MNLVEAVERCDIKEVKRQLRKGHVDDIDYALGIASFEGDLDIVKLLLDNGANIYADEDYPIRYAIQNRHQEVIDYLNKQMMLDKLKELI
jgi:hypothetical protein